MPLPEPRVASIENRHPFLLAFRSARFRFRLRTVSHVELPPEKGSTFHGALGHVLKRQAPLSYRFLYEPTSAEIAPASRRVDLPRPFALLPPLDTTTEFPEGSELSLELTFFSHAISQFSVCLAALATLGSIGIGRNRGRFEVAEVEAILPDGDPRTVYRGDLQRFEDSPEGVSGATIAASRSVQPGSDLSVYLTTRLRLKDHDHLVRRAPPSRSSCSGSWSARSAWAFSTIGTRPSTARRSEGSSTGRAPSRSRATTSTGTTGRAIPAASTPG